MKKFIGILIMLVGVFCINDVSARLVESETFSNSRLHGAFSFSCNTTSCNIFYTPSISGIADITFSVKTKKVNSFSLTNGFSYNIVESNNDIINKYDAQISDYNSSNGYITRIDQEISGLQKILVSGRVTKDTKVNVGKITFTNNRDANTCMVGCPYYPDNGECAQQVEAEGRSIAATNIFMVEPISIEITPDWSIINNGANNLIYNCSGTGTTGTCTIKAKVEKQGAATLSFQVNRGKSTGYNASINNAWSAQTSSCSGNTCTYTLNSKSGKLTNGTYDVATITGDFNTSNPISNITTSFGITRACNNANGLITDINGDIVSQSQFVSSCACYIKRKANNEIEGYYNKAGNFVAYSEENYTKECSSTIPGPTVKYNENMYVGNTINTIIRYALTPKYEWLSSNESVATINNGIITAVGEGKATITGVLSSTGAKATIELTVSNKPETNSDTKINLKINDSLDMKTVLKKEEVIKWTSSDSNIATVDTKGNVKVIKDGVVNIIAETNNKKIINKINVFKEVKPKTNDKSVVLLTNDTLTNSNVELSVKKIDKKEEKYNKYKEKIKNLKNMILYDVNLYLNGEIVQPNGEVLLEFDIPEGYDYKKIAVFRVETDGKLTKLDSQIVNGKIQTKTSHFSDYILAELDEKTDTEVIGTSPDAEQTDSKSSVENPQTGISVSVIVIALLSLASVGIYFYTKKKSLFNRI